MKEAISASVVICSICSRVKSQADYMWRILTEEANNFMPIFVWLIICSIPQFIMSNIIYFVIENVLNLVVIYSVTILSN